METSVLSPCVMAYRLRTARQKKRLQKEDRDKQLVQLDKRLTYLRQAMRLLPEVPLDEPYQKGWKRFFVLRHDVGNSTRATFYETLLAKINTVKYWPDKAFTVKRRRKGKKVREAIPQDLVEFTVCQWSQNKMKLTDAEKACFHTELRWGVHDLRPHICHVFDEPWRYVLKVERNMITKVKLHDAILEQQFAEVDQYIDGNLLRYRIRSLTNGRKDYWKRYQGERLRERYPFTNKALHTILDECNFEKENQ